MAKFLNPRNHKISPQKVAQEQKKIVLVGTYAGTQLTDWPGYYPYPITADDKVDAESCAKVNEIWLFKGTKEPKYFAAEFVGMKTREELKSLGYPAKGKGHGDGIYLLFKIERTYAPASSSAALAAAVESVIVRTKDFARSPKVRKQLKSYLESADRNDKGLAAQLPTIITRLPAETLRVCEAAVQMDFLEVFDVSKTAEILKGTSQCSWWVDRVSEYFAGKPLVMRFDSAKSIRSIVHDLIEIAEKRQEQNRGGQIVGAVLQHLVGAKLSLVLPEYTTAQMHGVSVSDVVSDRDGDFAYGDAVIHVTSAPGEAVIRKCARNIEEGCHPIVITLSKRVSVAEGLAESAGIANRIEVWDVEQFLSMNLNERGLFNQSGRKDMAVRLIAAYNSIIDSCETDPSLKIQMG